MLSDRGNGENSHNVRRLRSKMVELEQEVARFVLEQCPARTDEALQDRFGISYNTLRKIEAGAPIRASVAMRLKERICGSDNRD